MNEKNNDVNNSIQPLKNVQKFSALVKKVVNRPAHLPGIGVFSGYAGLGKTYSAMFAINQYRAFHVEIKWSWTQKALCAAILNEMGEPSPEKTVYGMIEQIADHLAETRRPLILDEADHLERRNIIEIVRDIYRGCGPAGGSILLIGEQHLPNKLKKWERVHSRVLDLVEAKPVDSEDVRHLCGLHLPEVEVKDDMLEKIRVVSKGSARRVVININEIREHANSENWDFVDCKIWGDRKLSYGGF